MKKLDNLRKFARLDPKIAKDLIEEIQGTGVYFNPKKDRFEAWWVSSARKPTKRIVVTIPLSMVEIMSEEEKTVAYAKLVSHLDSFGVTQRD